ncbi:MAG: putative oxidoreductase [Verrucomicrobia bacterium]|nr:putative oxidoreductase [Verrucomicrobiota bacterium]
MILYPSAPALGPICLGSSTFGREIDEAKAFALMDHAVARGITLIDTAATYSAGAAEKIVGAWLASRRPPADRIVVATKIYPPYTPAAIEAATRESAGRLGVDAIDVLYLHKWDATAETPDALNALERLRRTGRVRALGVSNFAAKQLAAVLQLQRGLGLPAFWLLQNNQNLAVRDVDGAIRDLCAAHDIAIVTYSPLGGGYLTGKHRAGVQPGSRFDVAPGHQGVYFNPACERRLARLAEVSARTGHPMPHLALAWALHQPGVASVLIGGRGPEYLDQAFAALGLDDPALFAELESV